MKEKDNRINLTEEILTQIRAIKLHAWQDLFGDRLNSARSKELGVLASLAHHQASVFGILGAIPELMTAVAFFSVFAIHGRLDAQIIFPTLGYWSILKSSLPGISNLMPDLFACMVSFGRIKEFLTDVEDNMTMAPIKTIDSPGIFVDNASFGFDKPLISGITLDLASPCLVTLSGPSGSGKSSMLQGLMGFLKPLDGHVLTLGRIAYVPQVPWLMGGTLRENIIFGRPFQPLLYTSVIRACALDVDIARFPQGDEKTIGGVGMTLSGGQMSRISIARALYSQADIYLLDDPLAALDTRVKAQIIEHVFGPQGLLVGATTIVVTDQPQLIQMARHNCTIEKGQFHLTSRIVNESLDEFDDALCSLEPTSLEDVSSIETFPSDAEAGTDSDDKLGSNAAAYRAWLGMAQPIGWVIVAGLIFIGRLTSGYSTYLLKLLAKDSGDTAMWDLVGFTIVGLVQSVCNVLFFLVAFKLCLIPVAEKIHARLSSSVIHSPMSYFNTTPLGTILNLFTNDISKIDGTLTSSLIGLLLVGSNLLLVIVVLLTPSPLALVFLVPLGLVYFGLNSRYLATARQLRMMELSTRSPIISTIQTAQSAYQSIIIYGQRNNFVRAHYDAVNDNVRMMTLASTLEVWLLLRLDLIGR